MVKLYVHMGMPKCGSTTVQNMASRLSTDLREKYGIYYGRLDVVYNNHYSFSNICRAASDLQGGINYLNEILRNALDQSCNAALVSSEELFYVLEDPKQKYFFENCIKDSGFSKEVEFILVHRDFRAFALSYIRQLMANGRYVCSKDNLDLGVYIYRLIDEFKSLEGFRTLIRLENDSRISDADLFPSRFFSALGVDTLTTRIPNLHDNAMNKSFICMDYLGGLLAGIDSLIQGLAINGPELDLVRDEIRNRPRSPEVSEFTSRLDKEVFDRIQALIFCMQTRIDADAKSSFNQKELNDAILLRYR